MIAGGGANLKKSSNAKNAMVQGLFGGGSTPLVPSIDAGGGELAGTRTLHDMRGATPHTILGMLDEDSREEYLMIFRALDEDDSGEITVKEMAEAFRTMGLELENDEIRDLVISVDQDSNGLIDIGEFSLMLYQLSTGTASQTHLRGIMKRRARSVHSCQRRCPRLNNRRKQVWRLMDDPSSSIAAQAISVFIMLLIVISCTAFVIETDHHFHRRDEHVWFALEAFCTVCFTLEYVLRIGSQQNLKQFLFNFMNTVDLVAIVPFYVEILMQALASTAADGEAGGFSSQSLRAVRLVRVFRLFKIGRHVSWLHVFADTYVASLPPLVMIVFVISIVMVFLASLVHTVEASAFDFEARMWLGPDGVPSAVASIPDGFWFAIVTMTTVGYGDITPNTPLGKLVGMIGSLVGIIVLAVPISVISLNFHDKYEAQERKNEQKHASKARLASLRKAITKDRLDRKVAKQAREGGNADIEAAAAAAATATANAPRGGEEKKDAAGFRTVVSLMHAAAERAVLSMNNDTVNVLTTEEHNRLDMKHEIKSMLEQWEPYKRVALIKRSQSAMML